MGDRLHILQHALGVDQYGRGQQYREHFCAGPSHADYETCCGLVADGLMTRRDSLPVVGGTLFYVTRAGRKWMAANSPAPPKLTRSQQRYRNWLEAESSLSFGDWLLSQRRTERPWFDPYEAALKAHAHAGGGNHG